MKTWVLTSPDSKIRFHFDPIEEDYYVDADFDYDAGYMAQMIELLDKLGYEMMSSAECEPDILDDYARIYVAQRGPFSGMTFEFDDTEGLLTEGDHTWQVK